MTVFEYIGKNYERIKKDVKIGITSYSVLKHWLIYSRYDYYRKTGSKVSIAVLCAATDNRVSENWVYAIIKKMEAEA